MIEHYCKHDLDYTILDILDTKYPLSLRYLELEEEINLHCKSKVSSSTLSRRLTRLVGRRIVDRKEERKYGPTYYSLTKQCKDSLDIQKKCYPANYLEKTLTFFDSFDYSFNFGKDMYRIGKRFSKHKV
jgi:DNA-binding HxlR family transcriptional regulator